MNRRPSSTRPHARGFTLVELLVAMAVSLLLVVVILAIAQSGMATNERLLDSTRQGSDALFALGVVTADLETLLLPRGKDVDALVAIAETVNGAPFARLLLLATPADRDPDGRTGGERAIAYRMAHQNPIDGQSTAPVYALYRSILSVEDTVAGPLVAGTSSLAYWNAATPAVTDPGNFLVGNVVRFALRFRRADTGEWIRIEPGKSILIDREGASVSAAADPSADPDLATNRLPSGVNAVEVELTLLTPKGAKLLAEGALDLAAATTGFGRTVVRQARIAAP